MEMAGRGGDGRQYEARGRQRERQGKLPAEGEREVRKQERQDKETAGGHLYRGMQDRQDECGSSTEALAPCGGPASSLPHPAMRNQQGSYGLEGQGACTQGGAPRGPPSSVLP